LKRNLRDNLDEKPTGSICWQDDPSDTPIPLAAGWADAVSVAAAAQFGFEGQSAGGPAFVAGEGTPHALIIVPVGAHMISDHSAAGRTSRDPQ
jgi:hypothetical protein